MIAGFRRKSCFLTAWLVLAASGWVAPAQAENAAPEPSTDVTDLNLPERMSRVMDLVQEGEFSEALKILELYVSVYPEHMEAQLMLSSIHIKAGNYIEAVKILDALLAIYPQDARLLNNYAWLLATAEDHHFRDPARALAMARDAILASPDDFHVWSTLAEAHYVNGNFQQAVRVLMQGIEIATRKNAPAPQLQSYRVQLQKLQEAAMVMSLIE